MAYVGASMLVADQAASCVRALATMWLVVALLSVAMGLLQYMHLEQWFNPWISQSPLSVAFANLRQRNQFATLCGIGLLALLYLCQSSKSTVKKLVGNTTPTEQGSPVVSDYWNMAWPWLAVFALALGNGLSGSRTGALQWLIIGTSVVCWRSSLHSSVKRLGYGSLLLYILIQLLTPWFAGVVGNENSGLWGRALQSGTGNSRLWLYSNVWELITQKPLLGWGWQELPYAQYISHFDRRFTEFLDNAHNLPLHLAVELGLPYAILFFTVVLVWIVRAAPWQERNATRQLAWGVLMLIGVHSMLEYPLWYGPFLITLGLCLGLLQQQGIKENVTAARAELAQAVNVFLIGVFLIITVYATYDYYRVGQLLLSQESRISMFRYNTWSYAKKSWLFKRKVQFVELMNTPISPQNASQVFERASELIHFSPEPQVIQALIQSAALLRKDDVVLFHMSHYKEAFPKEYEAWMASK